MYIRHGRFFSFFFHGRTTARQRRPKNKCRDGGAGKCEVLIPGRGLIRVQVYRGLLPVRDCAHPLRCTAAAARCVAMRPVQVRYPGNTGTRGTYISASASSVVKVKFSGSAVVSLN